MAKSHSKRRALLEELSRTLGRELSARTIMFHQAVADRLGLNATDHKCLDMARTGDAMTAGELALLTGLTTGAITGVIDRLERAGFVTRVRDGNDRRRVLVQPVAERTRAVAPLFESLNSGWTRLCAHYSDRELDVINRFMNDSIALLKGEAHKLRPAKARDATSRARHKPQGLRGGKN
jgi:DNA-binding MarR family transcriptional regulator